ncbi:MAG: SET domain-containing protein-lysine N-methyltransferase [Flavobacteriales bacterium]
MTSNPKIIRQRSKIHGNGVFAKAAIRKGEEIVDYEGRLITHDIADDTYGGEDTGHTFLFILNEHWVVDANVNGNIAKWINTSCDPNCVAEILDDPGGNPRKGRVVISALRSIKAGEELHYDYDVATDEPITAEERKNWACHCGAANCRGVMLKYQPKKPARAKATPAVKRGR